MMVDRASSRCSLPHEALQCGRLEHGFLRVRCDGCHAEHLLASSCKQRGLLRASRPAALRSSLRLFQIVTGDLVSPSWCARRMAKSAALLMYEVFPGQPVRQRVLRVPYPLRFLFASRPEVMGRMPGIVPAFSCPYHIGHRSVTRHRNL
jgi:hypothetical protein